MKTRGRSEEEEDQHFLAFFLRRCVCVCVCVCVSVCVCAYTRDVQVSPDSPPNAHKSKLESGQRKQQRLEKSLDRVERKTDNKESEEEVSRYP